LSNASCRTFKGHGKGVYPLIFIPAEDFDLTDGATINPGDTIISGSADMTARSWSFDTGSCLKVQDGIRVARFTKIPTFS
jgi:WD40 repeat protein